MAGICCTVSLNGVQVNSKSFAGQHSALADVHVHENAMFVSAVVALLLVIILYQCQFACDRTENERYCILYH